MAYFVSLERAVTVLLDQDIAHCFDAFWSIVTISISSLVAACARIVGSTASSKSYSGVTKAAVVLIVPQETDSCFCSLCPKSHGVETFFITVKLQRCIGANQTLPLVPTQWSGTIDSVCDQREQRSGVFPDHDKVYLLTDPFHTETDLGKRCDPVCRQLSFACVKASFTSFGVKGILVCPNMRVEVEGALKEKIANDATVKETLTRSKRIHLFGF